MVPPERAGGPSEGRRIMAVTKEQVLAALAKVPAPGGAALTDARVLSDVVVSDDKVYFSISVDAAAVKAWEPVRAAAEAAVGLAIVIALFRHR